MLVVYLKVIEMLYRYHWRRKLLDQTVSIGKNESMDSEKKCVGNRSEWCVLPLQGFKKVAKIRLKLKASVWVGK